MKRFFGKHGCQENKDWEVIIWIGEEAVVLLSQVTKKEAELFYEDLKKEIVTSKTGFIEVGTEKGDVSDVRLFNISQIRALKLTQD
jgi:hypothetical protein